MPLLSKTQPIKGGTAEIECYLKNTNNNMIDKTAIKNVTWTLTDSSGDIINGNENNTIANIENPLTVVLTRDDLPADKLFFTIYVIYDSDQGTDLNLVDQLSFYVQDTII